MRSSAAAAKAPIFDALGDETRLAIVGKLAGGRARSIADLTADTPLTRQAVTKHLRVLSDAGIVRHRRAGREALWELDGRKIDEAKRFLDRIGADWDAALGRLKAFVEG